jgi:hypothetical protein
MDKALQDYYEARFDMMTSKGWKDLLEDIDLIIKSYSNVLAISDEKELYKRQGQLDILLFISNLKQESERAWEELSNEKNV